MPPSNSALTFGTFGARQTNGPRILEGGDPLNGTTWSSGGRIPQNRGEATLDSFSSFAGVTGEISDVRRQRRSAEARRAEMIRKRVAPLVIALALAATTVLDVGSSRISLLRAREEGLRNNLIVMRQVIDQYRGDKGIAPVSLAVLVREGYLRRVPADPITGSVQTWQLTAVRPGVLTIRSGAAGIASDGTRYSSW